jgi:hypothetical protein
MHVKLQQKTALRISTEHGHDVRVGTQPQHVACWPTHPSCIPNWLQSLPPQRAGGGGLGGGGLAHRVTGTACPPNPAHDLMHGPRKSTVTGAYWLPALAV